MKYLILCVAALLASCQSIPVGPDIQAGPKPNVRPPIAGSVGKADEAAAQVEAQNRHLESQVDAFRDAVADAQTASARAVSEANRLRLQKTANEVELSELEKMVEAVGQRNLFFVDEVAETKRLVGQQRDLIVSLRTANQELKSEAALKDEDVADLEADNLDLRAKLAASEKNRQAAQKSAIKEAVDGAGSKSYKSLMRWILGGILIAALAYTVIQALKK